MHPNSYLNKLISKMKRLTFIVIAALFSLGMGQAQTNCLSDRALWASINGKKDASLGDYQQHTGKVLVTWRMLPGDDATTGFDLYRTIGTGMEKKIATNIKNRTCYQDGSASTSADNHYRLTYAGSTETLSAFTLKKAQVSAGLPYISIPLADTKDVYENTNKIVYTANDVSVGDLDGDGEFEIVVKRLQSVKDASGNIVSDGSGASYSQKDCLWAVICLPSSQIAPAVIVVSRCPQKPHTHIPTSRNMIAIKINHTPGVADFI